MSNNVRVEVLCKNNSCHDEVAIKDIVVEYISRLEVAEIRKDTIFYASKDVSFKVECPDYPIESITICDNVKLPVRLHNVEIIIFKLNERGPEIEMLDNDVSCSGGDEEYIPGSNHHMLPCREFHGLWESLIYEKGVKDDLLNFVETTMLFSRKNVDTNIVSCNRLVLLHGPPGTGKTSLCKALAQKLAIHMQKDYKFTHLIEINSHSLFSKWFSESGKLVMKLFQKIQELIDNPSSLVCVLIDEVESIAYSRNTISSNEPTDSLRVVNAVLTQLDRIRHFPNVLLLTTSNLTTNIDCAFLDRADIVQYIGNPTAHAIYDIYMSALRELHRVNIIESIDLSFSYKSLKTGFVQEHSCCDLLEIAELSVGFSGRTIRKVPFIAHSLFVKKEQVPLKEFLIGMKEAVLKLKADKSNFDLTALGHNVD